MMKVVPLKGSFMIISIVGFLFSVNVYSTYPSYGFAFMIVFTMMFVASLISMAKAPLGSYDLREEGILKKGEKE